MHLNTFINLNKNHITWHGRTHQDDQGIHFFYTASGFDVTFIGTKLFATFISDFDIDDKKPFLTVMVDGYDDLIIDLKKGQHIIKLIDYPYGKYTVKVRKRSESIMSKTQLIHLETDGVLEHKSSLKKTFKIEWIGDSLTCGFGNVGPSDETVFKTKDEDGLQSFASIVSKKLEADYHIVAVSGIGVYKSIYAHVTLPKIYPFIDASLDIPYDFSFLPNLIVINLGTNDNSYLRFLEKHTQLREIEAFTKAYMNFIHDVKRFNPNAYILCISQGNRQEHVDASIAHAVKMVDDKQVSHFRVSNLLPEDGMGSQFHPSIKTHHRWAIELYQHIKHTFKETQ